jgi:hypothetical protein
LTFDIFDDEGTVDVKFNNKKYAISAKAEQVIFNNIKNLLFKNIKL